MCVPALFVRRRYGDSQKSRIPLFIHKQNKINRFLCKYKKLSVIYMQLNAISLYGGYFSIRAISPSKFITHPYVILRR